MKNLRFSSILFCLKKIIAMKLLCINFFVFAFLSFSEVRLECEPFASFLDGLCNSLTLAKSCLDENGKEVNISQSTTPPPPPFIDIQDVQAPGKNH